MKYLEGKEAAAKVLETAVFTATRALFIGGFGVVAALIGSTRSRWLSSGRRLDGGSTVSPQSYDQGIAR